MGNWQVHTGSKVENLEVKEIAQEGELKKILDEFTGWDDPCIRLYNPNGDRVELTVRKPYALVQHMKASCEPPFLVGTDVSKKDSGKSFEFIYNDEAAQVPEKYCLPLEKMKEIALDYYKNGELPDSVAWEEIGPAEERPE